MCLLNVSIVTKAPKLDRSLENVIMKEIKMWPLWWNIYSCISVSSFKHIENEIATTIKELIDEVELLRKTIIEKDQQIDNIAEEERLLSIESKETKPGVRGI